MLKVKDLPQGKMYESFSERGFLILLGSLILVFISIIVWIGMSMPLLTQLIGNPAAVDTDFYVKTTSPLALVIAILIILIFVKFGLKSIRKGGAIAHIGVLTGLLAIIFSSSGETVSKELMPNVETEILGYKVIYQGQEFAEGGGEKFYVYTIDNEEVRALTKLKTNGEDAAREPAILRKLSGDIYIAPSPPKDIDIRELILKRRKFKMEEEAGYIFKESEIITDEQGNPKEAKVTISITDGVKVSTVEPVIKVTAAGGESEAIPFFDGEKRIRLTGISGDESQIRVEILPSLETLSKMPVTATFSSKPFIWLLWLSVISIFVGTLLASFKG